MFKELKYLFFLIVIFFFIFFISKYYFSDFNKKNSYRSISNLNKKIKDYSTNLITLENDTENIIEYVENDINKDKKRYYFLDLLKINEK